MPISIPVQRDSRVDVEVEVVARRVLRLLQSGRRLRAPRRIIQILARLLAVSAPEVEPVELRESEVEVWPFASC